MKEISLTQGLVATVDEEDFDSLNKFKWCTKKNGKTFYAHRMIKIGGAWTTITMHRQLLPSVKLIDHIDQNGLNNQKANLRPASSSENKRNQKKRRKAGGTSSKFKGVCRFKATGKWHAQIKVVGKRLHLGFFDLEEDAARAYDAAALKYFGEFAVFNFKVLTGI